MTKSIVPDAPQFGEELAPAHPSVETLALLASRRSTVANKMKGPGPNEAQLAGLLRLAMRVPDHGKLAPWRFIIFEGDARAKFGAVLRNVTADANADAPLELLDFEEQRFMRAPTVVAVISRVTANHKIPEWEQVLSAGAVCQNLLIGASAMGFAAQWITEWYAFDETVARALGLERGERVAGYVYIGSAEEPPRERARPDAADRVTRWEA